MVYLFFTFQGNRVVKVFSLIFKIIIFSIDFIAFNFKILNILDFNLEFDFTSTNKKPFIRRTNCNLSFFLEFIKQRFSDQVLHFFKYVSTFKTNSIIKNLQIIGIKVFFVLVPFIFSLLVFSKLIFQITCY